MEVVQLLAMLHPNEVPRTQLQLLKLRWNTTNCPRSPRGDRNVARAPNPTHRPVKMREA